MQTISLHKVSESPQLDLLLQWEKMRGQKQTLQDCKSQGRRVQHETAVPPGASTVPGATTRAELPAGLRSQSSWGPPPPAQGPRRRTMTSARRPGARHSLCEGAPESVGGERDPARGQPSGEGRAGRELGVLIFSLAARALSLAVPLILLSGTWREPSSLNLWKPWGNARARVANLSPRRLAGISSRPDSSNGTLPSAWMTAFEGGVSPEAFRLQLSKQL